MIYYNADKIKQIIADCANDVYFTYNGKMSGVTSEVADSIPKFQAWHGDDIKYYDNADDVMSDPFYSGKSLNEITKEINVFVS